MTCLSSSCRLESHPLNSYTSCSPGADPVGIANAEVSESEEASDNQSPHLTASVARLHRDGILLSPTSQSSFGYQGFYENVVVDYLDPFINGQKDLNEHRQQVVEELADHSPIFIERVAADFTRRFPQKEFEKLRLFDAYVAFAVKRMNALYGVIYKGDCGEVHRRVALIGEDREQHIRRLARAIKEGADHDFAPLSYSYSFYVESVRRGLEHLYQELLWVQAISLAFNSRGLAHLEKTLGVDLGQLPFQDQIDYVREFVETQFREKMLDANREKLERCIIDIYEGRERLSTVV